MNCCGCRIIIADNCHLQSNTVVVVVAIAIHQQSISISIAYSIYSEYFIEIVDLRREKKLIKLIVYVSQYCDPNTPFTIHRQANRHTQTHANLNYIHTWHCGIVNRWMWKFATQSLWLLRIFIHLFFYF